VWARLGVLVFLDRIGEGLGHERLQLTAPSFSASVRTADRISAIGLSGKFRASLGAIHHDTS
jgi:hypothetical protein